ncbi:hypothetical protein GCM10017559_80810 [Streptosporangium longisporum]|uniref:Uncharacterized protein n=1 Tax=Streptosporangium longisporum TaxID=46187 RepID=A0ABP6LI21_9ACTN
MVIAWITEIGGGSALRVCTGGSAGVGGRSVQWAVVSRMGNRRGGAGCGAKGDGVTAEVTERCTGIGAVQVREGLAGSVRATSNRFVARSRPVGVDGEQQTRGR